MMLNRHLFALLLLFRGLFVFAQNAPCGSSIFLDQATLADPTLLQQISTQNEAARVFFQNNAAPEFAGNVVTLPVVVHLIHFNGPENLSDAQVQLAIQRLNEAFANQGYYDQGSGTNVPIRFCLATRAPDGSATTGINRVASQLTVMTLEDDDYAIKNLSRWDTKRYINIWVVRSICTQSLGCGIVGYASSPAFHGAGNDGIVLEANYFNGAPATSSPGPHEMGHYLGLYHTFEGGCLNDDCLSDGDHVCDTPPDQSTAGIPCGQTVNSCTTDTQSGLNADLPDDTKNFMDYGDVACRHDFTAGQSARMDFFAQNTRQSLLSSDGCGQPCPALVSAAFATSSQIVDLGGAVNFTNLSQNAANYTWTIDGAPFSSLANPGLTFNNIGAFNVTLTAISADPNLCPAQTSSVIIQVVCPVKADFLANPIEVFSGGTVVLTNTSQGAGQFQWLINGAPQGPSLPSYAFDQPGAYEIRLEASNGQCSTSKTLVVTVLDSCIGSSFQKFYGTVNDEQGVASVVLSDGNFLIGGHGDVPGALREVLLIKTDPEGNVIWSKHFGAPDGNEVLQHVAAKPSGGGFMALLSSNVWTGVNDASLASFDADGQLLWQKRLVTPGADELRRIVATPEGGWIACGYVQPAAPGKAAAYFLKLDADGNQQWARAYGLPNSDVYATDVAVAADSSYRACGYYITAAGARDGLMLELDTDGALMASQIFDYPALDRVLWSVEVLPTLLGANVYFTGEETPNTGFNSYGLFVNKSSGGSSLTGNAYQLGNESVIFSDLAISEDSRFSITVNPPDSQPQPKAVYFQDNLNSTNTSIQQYSGYGQVSVQQVENMLDGALYTGRGINGGQEDIFFIRANTIGVAGVCPQGEVYFDNLIVLNDLNNLPLNEVSGFPFMPTQGMAATDYALNTSEPCAATCLTPSCKTAWTEYFADFGTNTVLTGIAPAPDGSYYAGGWRNNQTLLIKFSPDGTMLWSRQFHCSQRNDRLQDFLVDSDGNIAGVGNAETATLVFNGYAFRYDPVADVLLWVKEESQSERSRFTNIQELGPGGNYLIGGVYPTGTSSSDPDFDPVLLEMGRNTGDLLSNNWNQAFDLDKNEELRSVRRHGNFIYAVGRTESAPNPNSLRSAVIYRADLNGSPSDLRKIIVPSIGIPSLEATDIAFDGDSLVIALQGRFDTSSLLLTQQVALVKVAPDGQVLWLQKYTIENQNASTFNIVIQSLLAGDDGYYIATREMLLKTDKNGKFQWARHTYGRHDVGHNLIAQNGNAVFLVGKNVNPSGMFIGRYIAATGDAGSACGQDFGGKVTEETMIGASTEPLSWNQYASPLLLQTNTASSSTADLSEIGYLCGAPCTEICGNGRSDDYNSLIDCVDPACECVACNNEQARIWYFGTHAGLDFSTDPPTVLTDGATDSPGSTGVVCDAAGKLLLYTDGETIFNREHQPIPNGSGIYGSKTSLGNMLIPLNSALFNFQHANSSSNFYPYYSEMDMAKNQGLGGIRIINNQPRKNTVIDLVPVGNKVAATNSCSVFDTKWVLRKRQNTAQFLVTQVLPDNSVGVQPFSIDIGELDQNTSGSNIIAQMKFNHAGTLLADALPNSSGFDLLHFDPILGGLSDVISIRQAELAEAYTLEFSPDDRFLYVATPTGLYQFDLISDDAQAIKASRVTLASSATPRFGAIQMGPNGKLYIATGAGAPADALDVIFYPNEAGAACQYQANAQTLGTGRVRYGLPCIAPWLLNAERPIHIQGADSLCGLPAQSVYTLGSLLCAGADSVRWEQSGGIGGVFNVEEYFVQYLDTGTYRLVAKAWFKCGLKTDTLYITVSDDEAPALNLGPDIKVCENGVFKLDAGAGYARYRWQDGTADQTLTTSYPGVYWVTVWDACGNAQRDTVKITVDPGSQLDLGPNRVVCRLAGTSFELPDNFESWQWSPGLSLSCDTCLLVAIYPENVVNYVVTAQNADGCLSTDTVRVGPQILDAVLDTTICLGAPLEYLGQSLPSSIDTTLTLNFVTTDGCDLELTAMINIFPPLQVQLPADTSLKIGAELPLAVLSPGSSSLQYQWTPPGGLSCDDCPTPTAAPLQTVTYNVLATDANGCTATDAITLTVSDMCAVRAPTAFSPDGDGTNDTFYLLTDPCVYSIRSLHVWSRWGTEVYGGFNLDPNNPSTGWDGKVNGRDYPSDVLFWTAEVVYYDGRTQQFKGELTLLR